MTREVVYLGSDFLGLSKSRVVESSGLDLEFWARDIHPPVELSPRHFEGHQFILLLSSEQPWLFLRVSAMAFMPMGLTRT